MRVLLLTKRTRTGSEEVSERQTVLDAPEIRLGRGAPMEINLPEIDIDYHHATLTAEEGHLILSAVGDNGIVSNGKMVHDVVLAPGVAAEIGRYRFSGAPSREGADLVLAMDVLPVQTKAKRPEKRALTQVLPSRRALSWVFAVALIGVFIGWPISQVLTRPVPAPDAVVLSDWKEGEIRRPHILEATWSTGPLSKAHAEIGGECGACHYRAFEPASNQACLSCHATVQNHAVPDQHPMAELAGGDCVDCHREHMGGERPVQTASTGCTNCHANLQEVAPTTRLKPISAFLTNHPNFEPAIITEVVTNDEGLLTPVLVPRPFPPDAVLQERSGLKFPHNKHMAKDGVALISGRQALECADCHVTEPDGNLMRPIKMERDCGGCHVMEFAPAGTAIALPHADEAGVAEIVKGYFLARVAEGSVTLTPEPTNTFRRRIGGQNHRVQEELTAEWAVAQTERELDAIFGIRLCATCHEAEKVDGFATASGWQVHPALLQRHWMQRAEFSHSAHEEMDCAGCHAAVESASSTDVLMPQIETCQTCHRVEGEDEILAYLSGLAAQFTSDAEAATPILAEGAEPAPATCVTCHGFHRNGDEEVPAMSPAHAEAWRAAHGGGGAE